MYVNFVALHGTTLSPVFYNGEACLNVSLHFQKLVS